MIGLLWPMALAAAAAGEGQPLDRLDRPAVVVNQGGYVTRLAKRALGIGDIGAEVAVKDESGRVVLVVSPAPAAKDALSQESVRWIDFSALTQPGFYTLAGAGVSSVKFEISDRPYELAERKLLRSYYLQRCGTALHDAETGLHHEACHATVARTVRPDAVNPAGSELSLAGGWHDAGDYGRYVASTAVATARLLFAFEQAPKQFGDDLRIPESGNHVPDVLDEARVGLDWLMAMQRADGALYRKVAGRAWSKSLAPDQDHQPQLVYGASTPETGKAAAVLAQAARIYAKVDRAYGKRCLAAARKAWAFLARTPGQSVDWAADDDSGSGKYLASRIDREVTLFSDEDDRLAAAAELWLTTREAVFAAAIEAHIALGYNLYEWKDASILPLQSLALRDTPWSKRIRTALLVRARALLAKVAESGYGLANDRLLWGSNKMTAEEGITLVLAYLLTSERRYLDAAADQIAYLLGRNPFDRSFVTGVGARSVQHPCHLWGQVITLPIPGLLVGGPNPDDPSGHSPNGRGLLSYRDDDHSYGSNENAIDYNSALLGLLVLVSAAPAL